MRWLTPSVSAAIVSSIPLVADMVVDTPNVDTSVVDTSVVDTSVVDTSTVDTSIVDTSVVDTPLGLNSSVAAFRPMCSPGSVIL
jgi:hypothetical protein